MVRERGLGTVWEEAGTLEQETFHGCCHPRS